MTVQQMCDIAPDDSRGANLFIYSYTLDPRGLHLRSTVGKSANECWEIGGQIEDIEFSGTEAPISSEKISTYHLPSVLSKWIQNFKGNLRIAIDISCMSRPTMASVFQIIFEAGEQQTIHVDVLYVLAEYTPPSEQLPPNEDIRPISDWFAGWPTNATASTSLVVGLGYERDKASGACEYFDANDTWVFVPQSSLKDYQTTVEANNEILLARARRRDLLAMYCVERPTETFGLLASTVSRIVPAMNPVLLPFGPKIFFALSLLVASIYRETGVWHVTGDVELPDLSHAPSSHTSTFRVELGPPLNYEEK